MQLFANVHPFRRWNGCGITWPGESKVKEKEGERKGDQRGGRGIGAVETRTDEVVDGVGDAS